MADPNSKKQEEQVQKQEEVPPPVKKEEEVPPPVKQEEEVPPPVKQEEVPPQEKEEEVIPPPIEQNTTSGMEEEEEHEQNREKGDFSDHGGRQTGVDVVISRDEIERFSSPGM